MIKQYTNSNWLKNLKLDLKLSDIQKDVLIGTVLGDGYLRPSRSGKAARLQICHKAAAKKYVDWKYQIFKNLVFSKPRNQVQNNSLRFTTISHPDLLEYLKCFYANCFKSIPKNVCDILKSSLSLAVWFMDDGNGYLNSYALRISTYGFGLEGNLLLQNCLTKNFGVQTNLKRDVKGYQLYIPTSDGSALRFKNLIIPYVLPSMRYKIERRSPVETYIEGTR